MMIVRHADFHSTNRIATVLLVSITWFALSNHCLLGAPCASTAAPKATGCPMHMKSSEKAPPKQNNAGSPCCKTLRAVVTAKLSTSANTFDFVLKPFSTGATPPLISYSLLCLLALDTGPPDALSFSESVLQRSILAHAPPHR